MDSNQSTEILGVTKPETFFLFQLFSLGKITTVQKANELMHLALSCDWSINSFIMVSMRKNIIRGLDRKF